MDILLKLKAFTASADLGSFSSAARKLYASPSVITKRIHELEQEFGVQLFTRTTRSLALTAEGQAYLPRARELLRYFDETLRGGFIAPNELEGPIRIRSSVVSTLRHLGKLFIQFHTQNPRVLMQVTMADTNINPIEDGVDLAIGFFPDTYEGVSETPLHPYPLVTCASPSYIEECGRPCHPHDLMKHRCVSYMGSGSAWTFGSLSGNIHVNVVPFMTASNPTYLRDIALAGQGIIMISKPMVADCLRDKTLVEVLPDYLVEQPWMKILVPEQRLPIVRIRRLAEFIKDGCADTEPWA